MSDSPKAVFLSYAREDTRRRHPPSLRFGATRGYGGQAGRIRLLSAFSATRHP
jgi:hypothetical protein